MDRDPAIQLRGMTWNHHRGISPVEATSAAFADRNGGISFHWDARPLRDFESQPLEELAAKYDLIIIDHPHLGEAVREGLLVDLAQTGRQEDLEGLAAGSVGQSHCSYQLDGGQFALAVDAATGVACYRPDKLDTIPCRWEEVIRLARDGKVGLPLLSPHALMAFFWLANGSGFKAASRPDELLPKGEFEIVLERFNELASHISEACFSMDPIAMFDAMADTDDAPIYCAHAYGYISYSRPGFRAYPLTFTDIAEVNSNGCTGTVLGGTGIAVSAQSKHREIAVHYAFEIAQAACQTGPWVESGGQPGHRAAWLSEACNARTGNFMKNTLETLDGAWVRPRYDGYLPFQGRASAMISDYLAGRASQLETIESVNDLYRKSRR